jgi:hypothetical protein
VFPVNLTPRRDSNPGLLSLSRMRCPLSHAARSVYVHTTIRFRKKFLTYVTISWGQHFLQFLIYFYNCRPGFFRTRLRLLRPNKKSGNFFDTEWVFNFFAPRTLKNFCHLFFFDKSQHCKHESNTNLCSGWVS